MFKYRVFTFTVILSMLLFYATPINSIKVKAEEVTYTQRQLQDVGAWFIGERLLEGAISDFDFSNLPTDLTPEDFLADLGKVFAEGDPLPLMNDMNQAIDDIWNGLVEEYSNLSSEQAWDMVKDFFYTLWYDVPQSPSLPPLVNVFGIAGDLLEAADIDHLLQYANTDIPETYLPTDYEWFQNVNFLYFGSLDYKYTNFFVRGYNNLLTSANDISAYSYYITNQRDMNAYGHMTSNSNYCSIDAYPFLPLITIRYNSITGNVTYSSSNLSALFIDGPFTNSGKFTFTYGPEYNPPYANSNSLEVGYNNSDSPYLRDNFDSITVFLNWVYQNFYNVYVYVDDVLWVQPYIKPQNPIANRDLTYPNYEPAKYNYPEDTFVDWNRLYSIIYNAVRDGIVIDFGDLEDCFVDVNGQTAIATLGLVRNDYDNLVDEQFNMVPYPRFNNNLWLTNLADEMIEPAENGVAIIENAYNIFPIPLQKALLFAGALLLFGLLIRRFLE